MVKETAESCNYNENIIKKANCHLEAMKTSLAAVNMKLRVRPSGDVIVEEKHFASRFVVQALEELKKMTEEIDVRLRNIERVNLSHHITEFFKELYLPYRLPKIVFIVKVLDV